jgi:hypothetical protein
VASIDKLCRSFSKATRNGCVASCLQILEQLHDPGREGTEVSVAQSCAATSSRQQGNALRSDELAYQLQAIPQQRLKIA